MQILKIGHQLNTPQRASLCNQSRVTKPFALSNRTDTVTFRMRQNNPIVAEKTQKLLAQVVEKLNLKNSNMSKGYTKAVRNDSEVQAYYENTENLITHIRKLFSQAPDGKIVTFEKIDGVDAPDEFRIEQLVPTKKMNKYTGIHITADKAFLTTGETKELDSYCQRPNHTEITTKSTIAQFNKIVQKCLNELLSDKNTQF